MINKDALFHKVGTKFGLKKATEVFKYMEEMNNLDLRLGEVLDTLFDISTEVEKIEEDYLKEAKDSFLKTFNGDLMKAINKLSTDLTTIRTIKMNKILFDKKD